MSEGKQQVELNGVHGGVAVDEPERELLNVVHEAYIEYGAKMYQQGLAAPRNPAPWDAQPAHQPAAAPVARFTVEQVADLVNRATYRTHGKLTTVGLTQLLNEALTPSPVAPQCEDCIWHKCAGKQGGCGCKCHALAPVATEETQRLREALEWALKHTMFGQTDEWKHDYAKAKAVLAHPPAGTPEQATRATLQAKLDEYKWLDDLAKHHNAFRNCSEDVRIEGYREDIETRVRGLEAALRQLSEGK